MSQTWGDTLARQIRLQKRSIQLTNVDLTVAGLVQVINIGVTLPAIGVVVAHNLLLTDAFDSPGAGSLDVEIGDDSNDDNSIVAAYDAYTASANEGLQSNGDTLGINPTGTPSGTQLIATLTATTDNLNVFTNGDLTIEVWFLEGVNP